MSGMGKKTHIQVARTKVGLTQHEVAALIERSQSVYHRYETGAIVVPHAVAPKLAKLLRIPVMRVLYPAIDP